jgi:hypothetical protein
MASYIKAPLGPDGIVVMRGKLEKVESRGSATEVVHGDTDILLEKAREGWPELEWHAQKVSATKSIVKGDVKRKR